MPPSYGRSIITTLCAFLLSFFLFAHADTTPSAAQLLLQALTPPSSNPVSVSSTATAVSPAATSSTSALANTKATLIKTLYAEVQALEAQIAALEAASRAPSCVPLTLTRSLSLGATGADVSALQQFLIAKG